MTIPVHATADEAFIERALELADLNALRLALYQLTRDPELEDVPLVSVPIRGGASTALVPAPEYRDLIRTKAKEILTSGTAKELPPEATTDEDLRRLMETMRGGKPLTDVEFIFHKEQYALYPYPRAANWTRDEGSAQVPEGFHVAVIGAGVSGIAVAVQFEQLGIPYTIYERETEAGGTWYRNTYPDARVDTSSFIYQFSFEKRYPWSEFFARQDEVQRYLVHVAKKFGVYEKIRFGVDLEVAQFDEAVGTWELSFGDGSTATANAVIAATGLFATAKTPDIPGIDEFQGRIVHSLHWKGDIPVEGKRIAIIGNGSTGVQIFPRVVNDGAAQATVYQRTPQWISPLEGYREAIPEELRWLLQHMPYYWNWYCYSMVSATFVQQDAQVIDPEWQAKGGLIGERNDKLREILTAYIQNKLKDRPDLIEKVTPDYAPMARRLIVDNGWYGALLEDNTELVTDEVVRITPTGIVSADGVERPFDLIALATGFAAEKYLWPMKIVGRDGLVLEDVWAANGDGARAYLGMTVPKFPNFFIMYGPNAQPRAGSLVCWFEVWSQHAAQGVVTLIEAKARSIEVKQEAFDAHQRDLAEAEKILVWENESPRGRNYYVNSTGRQQVNSPFRIEEYRARFSRPFSEVYELEYAQDPAKI